MDERLKRRIIMFYAAGVINVFLGLYVLIEGASVMPQETATWLVIFFLAFGAIDFYMPYAMKKKWEEDQARRRAGLAATGNEGGNRK
jgi:uncharacterized membrane protein